MFFYSAFNLTFAAALQIPQFQSAVTRKPDVEITLGFVPLALENPTRSHSTWQAKPNDFMINIDGIARYRVTNGNSIQVHIYDGANETEVRNFLLGSAIAALLQQRKLLTLHASAIKTPKGAVLFSGRSGHGKSTLMTQFEKRGYQMIADDITAVDVQDGRAVALPAFPSTRLTQTSLDHLALNENYALIGSSIRKFQVPVAEIAQSVTRIFAVIFLDIGAEQGATITPLNTKTALREVMRLTYRANFMRSMGLNDVHFDTAAVLSQNAEFHTLNRVGNAASFDLVADLVTKQLGL